MLDPGIILSEWPVHHYPHQGCYHPRWRESEKQTYKRKSKHKYWRSDFELLKFKFLGDIVLKPRKHYYLLTTLINWNPALSKDTIFLILPLRPRRWNQHLPTSLAISLLPWDWFHVVWQQLPSELPRLPLKKL